MSAELQAIRDAWDKAVGDGRDEDETRSLADQYVADHPEQFAALQALGDDKTAEDQCVQAIDVLRDQPDNPLLPVVRTAVFGAAAADIPESDQWFVIQVWLWHQFQPRNIGGEVQARLRVSGGK